MELSRTMISDIRRNALPLVLLLSVILIALPSANALTFTPKEAEWAMWPEYCRARYVVSGAGRDSLFSQRISAADVASQKSRMGEGWNWLHHYCAALAYLSRAETAVSDRQTNYWLQEAEVNFVGYYRRIRSSHPMFIEVVIRLAQVHRKRGHFKDALQLLSEGIEAHPLASSPYALAAMIHKDSGDIDEAISILIQGNSALAGGSAELHYFLGLMYIDRGDLDSAAEHARRAYDLGYPLPGLATKLQRLGVIVE